LGPLELNGRNSPVAQGSLRPVQHIRDREEIGVRTTLTIKYEFILRSDLPEFACRGALGSRGTQRTRRSSCGKKRAPIDFLAGEPLPQGVHGFPRAGRDPPGIPRIKSGAFARNRYSAACRTWRAVGVRMVTSSSAAVGCNAMVASKSALVAFILTAMPSTCTISAAPSPTI
jgi:hypothetical protein